MHFLGRFRILTKILFVVGVLAALIAGVAYIAIDALAIQNDNAKKLTWAATRTLLAARANQNVIAMNRAEYRIALDREKASALGLTLSQINDTISGAWGSSYVNDFLDRGRTTAAGSSPWSGTAHRATVSSRRWRALKLWRATRR